MSSVVANGDQAGVAGGSGYEPRREPIWPLLREVYRRLGAKGLLVVALAVPVGLLYHSRPESRLARIAAVVTRTEAMRREALASSGWASPGPAAMIAAAEPATRAE
jgi:hypothetical protein